MTPVLPVASLYAAALAILFLVLSKRVIDLRRRDGPSLGDGDAELMARVRAHGNFAEYAPFGLLLLAMVELNGAPGLAVHVLGALLLAGRLLHAWSLPHGRKALWARIAGMALTLLMIGIAAGGLVSHALV